jgi:ribosome-associated protein
MITKYIQPRPSSNKIIQFCCRLSSNSNSSNNSSNTLPPPNSIPPQNNIVWRFVRSSGPGGQNVNKISSACEGRFEIKSANWIPSQVRERLVEKEHHRINSVGELIVTSQEERTQQRNKALCEAKILDLIKSAWEEPKQRIIQIEPPPETKTKWKVEKKFRSSLKNDRKGGKDDY